MCRYAVLEQAMEAQDESLFSSTIVFAVENSINRRPLDPFTVNLMPCCKAGRKIHPCHRFACHDKFLDLRMLRKLCTQDNIQTVCTYHGDCSWAYVEIEDPQRTLAGILLRGDLDYSFVTPSGWGQA
jgi:hypothetical protein